MIQKLPNSRRPIIKLTLNLCGKQKPRTQFENTTYRLITTGFGVEDGKLCPIKVNGSCEDLGKNRTYNFF
jgi:hypothetical protein